MASGMRGESVEIVLNECKLSFFLEGHHIDSNAEQTNNNVEEGMIDNIAKR
jgi:hypothetical protein